MAGSGSILGNAVLRVEDPTLLTGQGKYVDDIQLPGMLHGALVRSPYAHARIKGIDKTKALAVPGVVAVLTADDLKPVNLHWMPTLGGDVQAVCAWSPPCDLTSEALWTPEALTRNLVPLLGCGPKEDLERYRKASPMSQDVKGAPPMLLIVGSEDKSVPTAQAEEFAKKVNRAGGAARLLVMQGEGHTWTGSNLLKSIDEMLSFLDGTLKKR